MQPGQLLEEILTADVTAWPEQVGDRATDEFVVAPQVFLVDIQAGEPSSADDPYAAFQIPDDLMW
jgi:uncharacterized protein YaiL (DUF2058 family)